MGTYSCSLQSKTFSLSLLVRRVYKARHKETRNLSALKVLFNIEEEDGVNIPNPPNSEFWQFLPMYLLTVFW